MIIGENVLVRLFINCYGVFDVRFEFGGRFVDWEKVGNVVFDGILNVGFCLCLFVGIGWKFVGIVIGEVVGVGGNFDVFVDVVFGVLW